MSEIFLVTLPVFFIIITGFLAARFNLAKESWEHTLSMFVYYIALPALLVTGFWELDFTEQALLHFVGVHAAVLIGTALVVAFVLSLLPGRHIVKASVFMGSVIGNTVYMGFPVAGRAFGADAESTIVLSATLYLLIGLVLSLIYVEMLTKGQQSLREHVRDFAKNPLLIALGVGVVLNNVSLSGAGVDVLRSTLDMLGRTASPVALFALGLFFSGASWWRNIGWVGLASVFQLVLFPALAVAVLAAHKAFLGTDVLPAESGSISVVIGAMPAAVTTFVLAERFQLDRVVAANTIIVSTILSFVTLALILPLL